MHRQGADSILTVAAVLKISDALLFLYKLVTYPKWKDFFSTAELKLIPACH
jgi:hypothetical protein